MFNKLCDELMKTKLLIILIMTLSFKGFGQSQYKKMDGYVIRGEIEGNYKADKVYLIEEAEIQGDWWILDSAKVVDNKYVFEGKAVKYPRMYFIKSADPDCVSPLTPFFLENGEICIHAKADFFMNSTVKGTPNNDIYNLYRFHERYIKDSVQKGGILEHKIYGEQSFEVENKKFKARSQILHDRIKDLGKKMAKLFPDQVFAPFVIYWSLRYDMDLDDLKSLRSTLDSSLDEHPYTKQLDRFIRLSAFGVGSEMFDFTLPDVSGNNIQVSDFKGKYLLVDFWASWCGPCRGELPGLVKLYKKCKGKNFEILGVSLDTKKDAWISAIKKYNLKWPQVCDFKMWTSLPAQLCGVTAVPYTVLVDPEGKVIALGLRGEELYAKVIDILGLE